MSTSFLPNDAKVAVIGGGISGAAFACSLLQNARTRSKTVQVKVYEGTEERGIAPAVLTPECRSRLAGLGCRVEPSWRTVDLRGVEVIAAGARHTFAAPSGGMWVVDRWLEDEPGGQLIARRLAQVATAQGARFLQRQADRVEHQPTVAGVHQLGANPGQLVVRAGGGADRFHGVALASGAGAPIAEAFFPGFEGAPTLPAVQARIRHGAIRSFGGQLARLWIAPMPGMDGLWLIPGHGSTYAIGYGPSVAPADLVQAVMSALRDGMLPEGAEIAALSVTRVPAGAGTRLTAPGQLAVGPAASGHPLQLGLSEALASATRGAMALMDAGGARGGDVLQRRFVREAMLEMLEDANDATRASTWLRRAGRRAVHALAHAKKHAPLATPFSGGVLGLSAPTPDSLLWKARWAAVKEKLARLFVIVTEPLPASAVIAEPDLYYVVDDDPSAREALSSYLEAQGAEVVSFADELSLFCAVARRPPTAILLDVVLNWVDGLRLCEGLKQHPLTRDVPVYVMSGLNRPHVRARAIDAGAEAFLPKPILPDQVVALVRARRGGGEAQKQDGLPPTGAEDRAVS